MELTWKRDGKVWYGSPGEEYNSPYQIVYSPSRRRWELGRILTSPAGQVMSPILMGFASARKKKADDPVTKLMQAAERDFNEPCELVPLRNW